MSKYRDERIDEIITLNLEDTRLYMNEYLSSLSAQLDNNFVIGFINKDVPILTSMVFDEDVTQRIEFHYIDGKWIEVDFLEKRNKRNE